MINGKEPSMDFSNNLNGNGTAFSFYPPDVRHSLIILVSALNMEKLASKIGKYLKVRKSGVIRGIPIRQKLELASINYFSSDYKPI